MFSETSRLADGRSNRFYGSSDDESWDNLPSRRKLAIAATTIVSAVIFIIGVVVLFAIPAVWETALYPADPVNLLINSSSILQGPYENAGISSDDVTCSNIGRRILESRNGSVVDSAVAVALCLGVVAPQSSGLGGGLFMTIYMNRTMYSLNARETAPRGVNSLVYANGTSGLAAGMAVGIPSELAGFYAAHKKFGRLQWSEVVKPARELAQNGFNVSSELGKTLLHRETLILNDAVLRSEFINNFTGKPWKVGDLITRPRLARTLERLENVGAEDFYNGTISIQIVEELVNAGGIFASSDFSHHRAKWVKPIIYKLLNNLTMVGLPFPSSGPVVGMALGMLQGYGRRDPSEFTPEANGLDLHRLIETIKFSNGHRTLLADPFDENEDLAQLQDKILSPDYAYQLRGQIFDYQTFNDDAIRYGAQYSDEKDHGASHVSIIGPNGDAVSLSTSINSAFGAGFMGNLTGLVYNNQIAAFSFPNQTHHFDIRRPNPHNFIAPGKQPASSMTPLIFLNSDGRPVLATGGSGGTHILPALISTTWRALYRDMHIKEAIDFPRFTTRFEYYHDLVYEYGIPASTIEDLKRRGHRTMRVDLKKHLGNVNSVCVAKITSKILANADYRKNGGSTGF